MIFVNTLLEADRQALLELTRTTVVRVAGRAWIVLWSAHRVPIPEIAARLHCKPKTVRQRTVEMIAFLHALCTPCTHYQARPIWLILEHASLHKSSALQTWLAAHPQLELIFLTKFGGHRDNPIENLWWHLKGYAAANRCCRSMDELLTVVTRYLDTITPERVFQLVA